MFTPLSGREAAIYVAESCRPAGGYEAGSLAVCAVAHAAMQRIIFI
jgi:hypothetical protein